MTIKELLDLTNKTEAERKPMTMANIIGGALSLGGIYAGFQQQPKSYIQATRPQQAEIAGLEGKLEGKIGEIEKGLATDMAGYEQMSQQQAQAGLGARGITDAGVAKEVKSQTAKGLSGAYAAAASALAQAKLNARARLSGALSTYQQDLAQRQYKSLLQNYYGKMGLYGALGGLGGAVLALPSLKKKPDMVDEKSAPVKDTSEYGLRREQEGI